MDIGAQLAAFATNDKRDLGVGLQLQKPVDDLDAGAFEIARPADIGFLVKTRLELDHCRDRFAGLGGLGERLHDRAVVAGAVERLLDRRHRRIARGLAQELDDDVEAFIGMMDDDVLLPDRGEAIPAEIADPLRKPGIVRCEDQIRALVDDQLLGVVEAENAVGRENVARRGVEPFHQKAAQFLRHRRIDREQDDVTAPAAL